MLNLICIVIWCPCMREKVWYFSHMSLCLWETVRHNSSLMNIQLSVMKQQTPSLLENITTRCCRVCMCLKGRLCAGSWFSASICMSRISMTSLHLWLLCPEVQTDERENWEYRVRGEFRGFSPSSPVRGRKWSCSLFAHCKLSVQNINTTLAELTPYCYYHAFLTSAQSLNFDWVLSFISE